MRFIDDRLAACLAVVVMTGLAAGCSAPLLAPPPPSPRAPAAAPPQAATALPARRVARSWDEFRRNAASRIVAANPGGVYPGPAPDPLLAIPVLEIELDADGGLRRIKVLRYPTQAKDTTQLAIDAVHRAAPFGRVAHLPATLEVRRSLPVRRRSPLQATHAGRVATAGTIGRCSSRCRRC